MLRALGRHNSLTALAGAGGLLALGSILVGLAVLGSGIEAVDQVGLFLLACGFGAVAGVLAGSAWSSGLELVEGSTAPRAENPADAGGQRAENGLSRQGARQVQLQSGLATGFALLFLGHLLEAFAALGSSSPDATTAGQILAGLGAFGVAATILVWSGLHSLDVRRLHGEPGYGLVGLLGASGFLLLSIASWTEAAEGSFAGAGDLLAVGILAALGYLVTGCGVVYVARLGANTDRRSLGLVTLGLALLGLGAVLRGMALEVPAGFQAIWATGFSVLACGYLCLVGAASWHGIVVVEAPEVDASLATLRRSVRCVACGWRGRLGDRFCSQCGARR